MWGPRSIAKLVPITPIASVYGTQINNEPVTGANLNQLITGGPHIVGLIHLELGLSPTYQMGWTANSATEIWGVSERERGPHLVPLVILTYWC